MVFMKVVGSAAGGAKDALKGGAKIGGVAAKGIGAGAKAAKAGFKALPTSGKVAVAGGAGLAGLALAKKALASRGKRQKAASAAMYGGGGNSNPYSGANSRARMMGEEVQQLDEILPALLPFAGMAAKAVGGGLARKAAGGLVKNMAGNAMGKMFKKSKAPGEEATTS